MAIDAYYVTFLLVRTCNYILYLGVETYANNFKATKVLCLHMFNHIITFAIVGQSVTHISWCFNGYWHQCLNL